MSTTALGLLVAAGLAGAAIAAARSTRLPALAFPLSIIAGMVAALSAPGLFLQWGGYPLVSAIPPLIQIIMFGMGMTLSVADFRRVLTVPHATLVGAALQFGVMPILGLSLARVFGFSGATAAGIVLVGSVPGGVASNVMTYLARGNVALSVTMTAVSTMLSPFMTPLAMTWLAGTFVPVSASTMMWSILQMVVAPVLLGLLANHYLYHRLSGLQRWLPRIAMAAIWAVITITAASTRDQLLSIAVTMVAVVLLHNGIGYVIGYWGARATRLPESAARTVSIEVGLQNAGLAAGLALSVLNSPEAALAAAVFAPTMNITGSMLAAFWRKRPVETGGPAASAGAPPPSASVLPSH
jgi:bile acid:Na+ symporter, BASS family